MVSVDENACGVGALHVGSENIAAVAAGVGAVPVLLVGDPCGCLCFIAHEAVRRDNAYEHYRSEKQCCEFTEFHFLSLLVKKIYHL